MRKCQTCDQYDVLPIDGCDHCFYCEGFARASRLGAIRNTHPFLIRCPECRHCFPPEIPIPGANLARCPKCENSFEYVQQFHSPCIPGGL